MNTATVYQLHRGQESMPSKNGYISLWRDIKQQPWYKRDHIARSMFVDMLLDAQHKAKSIEVDGQTVFLTAGQLFTKRVHFVEQGIDDSKVKRVLAKFEQEGIIARETIRIGKRSIGTRITFLNWAKWQKIDQSIDQSSDQPHTAEIKALSGYSDQSCDQSSDQENNNDNNNKKNYVGLTDQRTEILQEGFEAFWKHWGQCKKLIGKTNTAAKPEARKRFFEKFPASWFKARGEDAIDQFDACVSEMMQLALDAHQDLANNPHSDYYAYRNMHPQKFFRQREWGASHD